jgi:hypothetical protein
VDGRTSAYQGGRPWDLRTVFFLDCKDTSRPGSEIEGTRACGVSLSLSSFDMRRPSMAV